MTHSNARTCTWLALMPALLLVVPLCSSVEARGQGSARSSSDPQPAAVGRPVRILSLSFREKSREQVVALVDQNAAAGVDLVILPETWLGQNDSPETLEGPTITA